MSSLQEIEAAIEKLPREEAFALGEWLQRKLVEKWDAELEGDIEAGRLDALASRVLEEHQAGESRDFPADEE